MDIEMKPKKFMPGQAVTRINNKPWNVWVDAGGDKFKPLFGKIYHVMGYSHQYNGHWIITLVEGGPKDGFTEYDFAPVITDHELESELSEIEITVTI